MGRHNHYGVDDVELSNGETGQVETCKSGEDGHDYHVPLDDNGDSMGISFDDKDDAIEYLEKD